MIPLVMGLVVMDLMVVVLVNNNINKEKYKRERRNYIMSRQKN